MTELDRELAAEPTGAPRVHHAKARASLPTAEAKAWAWSCFTGETDVPNYELEAAGHRPVARRPGASSPRRTSSATSPTSPRPSQVRSGWILAEAAEYFFPRTSLTQETLARAEALIADGDLDLSHPAPAGRRGGRPSSASWPSSGLSPR